MLASLIPSVSSGALNPNQQTLEPQCGQENILLHPHFAAAQYCYNIESHTMLAPTDPGAGMTAMVEKGSWAETFPQKSPELS